MAEIVIRTYTRASVSRRGGWCFETVGGLHSTTFREDGTRKYESTSGAVISEELESEGIATKFTFSDGIAFRISATDEVTVHIPDDYAVGGPFGARIADFDDKVHDTAGIIESTGPGVTDKIIHWAEQTVRLRVHCDGVWFVEHTGKDGVMKAGTHGGRLLASPT